MSLQLIQAIQEANLIKIIEAANTNTINEIDGNGFTPLMHAVTLSSSIKTKQAIIERLLEIPGIDLNIRDKENHTIVELAKKYSRVFNKLCQG